MEKSNKGSHSELKATCAYAYNCENPLQVSFKYYSLTDVKNYCELLML